MKKHLYETSNFMGNSSKLLKDVDPILEKHKKIETEQKGRGEQFNIFNILGVLSEHVRFHTAFLAELLNTKGTHGRRDTFLKEFINILGLDDFGLDTLNSDIKIDYPTGRLEEYKGGKIDLLIRSNGKAILIVNNIYDNIIPNQLVRYVNFSKKYDSRIFYLTLDGDKPSSKSLGDDTIFIDPNQYQIISYRDTILQWLQRSVEIASSQPFVRETINQYITLITELTHQSQLNESHEQIISMVLGNPAYLIPAFTISACLPQIKKEIYMKFINGISTKLDLELADNVDPGLSSFFFRYKGVNLFFGEEKGRLYCSIRTNKSMSCSDKKIWDADIFDFYSSPRCNPFGWSYIYKEHWNTNPELFYDMTQEGSELQNTIEEWVEKMKESVDTELSQYLPDK